MEWQQMVALGIVGLTAGLFGWARWRPRKFSLARDTHCGCSAKSGRSGPQSSLIFRARRGERPQVVVKMK